MPRPFPNHLLPRLVAALGVFWVGLSAAQPASPPPRPSYEFQIGDVVEFRFIYSPELNFSAPVRPDGAISFPFLGDRLLLGITPSALAETLRAQYAPILKDPELFVTVKEFKAPRVFVTGEVTAPGAFDYRHGVTAMQALSSAGGYRETASRQALLVLRSNRQGALLVTKVDLTSRAGRLQDPVLAPDDIVVVPRSGIAKVNQAIRQYVRGVLPVGSLGLFFNTMGTTVSTSLLPIEQ